MSETPLIPRVALLGNASRSQPRISSDGTRLAYLAPSEIDVLNLWVRHLEDGRETQVTKDRHRGIGEYRWAEDGSRLLYLQDQNGDENWHVFSTDLKTGEVRDLTPFPGVAAQNLITHPRFPGFLLVALNKPDPTRFHVYRIDLETGGITLEVENPGDVSDWATDSRFRVRGATVLQRETSDTILRVRDPKTGAWRDVVRWPFEEAGSVLYRKILGFTPDGDAMYVQSSSSTVMSRLVLLDTHTGEEREVLAADERSDLLQRRCPANTWWVPEILFHPETHHVQAVAFDYLVPEWRVLDAELEEDFAVLHGLAPAFRIESRDGADRRWVVSTISDRHPPAYHLYDRSTRRVELLFESHPGFEKYRFSRMRQVTIPARDGVTIPGYLTLPTGGEEQDLPMVLFPHGGPWARDYWGFDPWVQLLANRGYAVLQPNFRGSTGYGREYLNAGTGGWGRGVMQHDLTDAVAWAVSAGIADPQRVAILGWSYGGYATLAGVAFTPDLYACAVAVVAPSNIRSLLDSMPPTWGVRKLRWKKRIGLEEEDEEFSRSISPLFHVEQIRTPLLIGHGQNDPRVKLAESENLVKALRENGQTVEFVVYPDEGHGFVRPDNNLDFAARMEEFLARHLGGRKEPAGEIPGTSAEVR